MRFKPVALVLVLSAGCCSAAALGTLGQPVAGSDVVSHNTWQATSFTLAETAPAQQVRHVSLKIAQLAANANLALRITGSLQGRPNNADVRVVFTIPPDLPAVESVVTFQIAPASPSLLLPGETYWLSLGMTAPDFDSPSPAGLIRWSYAATSAADAPSAAGWTVSCCVASSGTEGAGWQATAATPYLFAIQARPLNAAPPAFPDIAVLPSGMNITARGAPGVSYELESSTNLSHWTLQTTLLADTAGVIRYVEPAATAAKFYRFR